MPKIAFLFPGQGAQSIGMAKDLCANFPLALAVFDRAREILGYDLADICFHGPEDRLDSTELSQPAIFVASWAALQQLRHDRPDLVASCQASAGLSLGEYTALAFSDSMSFEDTLAVVRERGRAMQAAADATPSGMATILGLEREQVEGLCREARNQGRIWVANLLGPGNIVVSGERNALDAITRLAEAAGAARVIPLPVAGAFHTDIMRPADQRLAKALDGVQVKKPRIPVTSNVDATAHSDPLDIRQVLVRQVLSPVLWEESICRLLADGFDQFCEIGPGRVLKGLLRRIDRKVACESFGS